MDLHRKTSDPILRASLAGQIRQARQGSIATANELKDFLHAVKGHSPDQLLGVVAQSELIRATITATIAAAILMAILTVGPYLMGAAPVTTHPPQEKKEAPAAVATPAAPATPAAATGPDGKPVDPTAVTIPGDKPTGPSKDDIAKKLGVNEAKTADPKSNPLDGKGDDLLKGFEK
jgi:hypothetical protein